MTKHTSADRDELDEADTTARTCDGCGRWTVRPWHLTHGGESFAFCPDCIGAPARRAAATLKATQSAKDAAGPRPLVCRDCGTALPRRTGTSGRQRERCLPCGDAYRRAWHRDYYARTRGTRATDPRPEDFAATCDDCGEAVPQEAPGGKCSRCLRARWPER